jgi:hypothetical protein
MSPRHRHPHVPWDSHVPEREPPQICATTGKRMYASEAEAKSTAHHRMSQNESRSALLRAYHCLYCEAWHLTSKQV